MGLRMEKFNIMGILWRKRFLAGFMRNQYIGENCFKRQSWAVCRFKGNLAKNREGEGGVDNSIHSNVLNSLQAKISARLLISHFTQCTIFRKSSNRKEPWIKLLFSVLISSLRYKFHRVFLAVAYLESKFWSFTWRKMVAVKQGLLKKVSFLLMPSELTHFILFMF